jgi:hypothetical protein
MKTFILFLYGSFETHEDVEYFCFEKFGVSPAVNSVRFVIENEKNIIVIFDSELGRKELSKELHEVLPIDNIKFYFLFERESIYTANLPVQMKDFIFKPKDNHTSLKIEYDNNEKNKITISNLNLDKILDKIELLGIDSLSEEEKNFLDNFEN